MRDNKPGTTFEFPSRSKVINPRKQKCISRKNKPTGTATQTFCNSGTLVNLIATGSSIKWYAATSGGSSLALSTPLVSNAHYYSTQTINGCESATRLNVKAKKNNCLNKSLENSIDENSNSDLTQSNPIDMVIYPNPTEGIFNVEIKNALFSELSIFITDIQGKIVYSNFDKNSAIDYSKQINLTNLAKGIYFIKVITESNDSKNSLLIFR